ncbi:MAG: 2-oxo-4-hydroxy-4-carboxy-5-ureidoimidazoline decarboxylase [Gemmatimonadales bacterium]
MPAYPDQRSAIERLFEGDNPLLHELLDGMPYRSDAQLMVRAREIVEDLSNEQRVQLINLHPRIGDTSKRLKSEYPTSYAEQGADQDISQEGVLELLESLNKQYEARFGFRFVVFVNGRPKPDLIPILRHRLQRSRDEELETALAEILAITADRLSKRPLIGQTR